jgi:hypothetical protein
LRNLKKIQKQVKMKRITVLFLFVSILVLTGFQSSDKKEKKAKQKLEMAQLIHNGRFKFVPKSASSSIGNINNIESGYEMIFDSLNFRAHLPYYGRTYASLYEFTNGVRFDYTAKRIDQSWHERKKIYTIKFDMSTNLDSYSIDFSADLNGFANLKITFSDKELISYYGTIEKIEPDQKMK